MCARAYVFVCGCLPVSVSACACLCLYGVCVHAFLFQ